MMKAKSPLSLVFVILLISFTTGCKKESNPSEKLGPNLMRDIDGNIYKTVTIGSRTWMAENLKVIHYRNGDPIPNITDATAWMETYKGQTGAICDYANNPANSEVYGKLYNWYAVNDARNLAPAGWHVPNESEWMELQFTLGDQNIVGGKLKETGTTHWKDLNTGATNETGFSALPGGGRFISDGEFMYLGECSYWWTSSLVPNTGGTAYSPLISNAYSWLGTINSSQIRSGLSVRCVKDLPPPQISSATIKDFDGNAYHTVKIGNKEWMVENLKVTHFRNGDPIPNVADNNQWANLSTGAYCNKDNDNSNTALYGKLYNWYAVTDLRSLAPTGWHVATDEEWNTLIHNLGGDQIAGGRLKESGTAHWKFVNAEATNESGFTALPGSMRIDTGEFLAGSSLATWWPFLTALTDKVWRYSIPGDGGYINKIECTKRFGYSVRCVRD